MSTITNPDHRATQPGPDTTTERKYPPRLTVESNTGAAGS
jgi:hypothetical protein